MCCFSTKKRCPMPIIVLSSSFKFQLPYPHFLPRSPIFVYSLWWWIWSWICWPADWCIPDVSWETRTITMLRHVQEEWNCASYTCRNSMILASVGIAKEHNLKPIILYESMFYAFTLYRQSSGLTPTLCGTWLATSWLIHTFSTSSPDGASGEGCAPAWGWFPVLLEMLVRLLFLPRGGPGHSNVIVLFVSKPCHLCNTNLCPKRWPLCLLRFFNWSQLWHRCGWWGMGFHRVGKTNSVQNQTGPSLSLFTCSFSASIKLCCTHSHKVVYRKYAQNVPLSPCKLMIF